MGIKGLTALLSEVAPKSMTEHDIKTMFGRKVAIDASMSLYQFLIAVRSKDGEMLTNDSGEVTSHLMGTFYRTIRMCENGIKPCYVFDGKPPDMKKGVLAKRFEKRQEAKAAEDEAKEVGTVEEAAKLNSRQVRVSKEQNAECQKLLKLMGIPVVLAPSEAEAQCAELVHGGLVYGAGSEDMDTLTFNAPVLLRHLTFSEAKKVPINEIHLDEVLKGLDMTMEQFVELCILMGCDYVEPLKGLGPKTALKMMRDYGSLAKIVKVLREKQADREAEDKDEEEKEEFVEEEESENESEDDERKMMMGGSDGEGEDGGGAGHSSAASGSSPAKSTKKTKVYKATIGKKKGKSGIVVPDDWNWEGAKEFFLNPEVTKSKDLALEWTPPDTEGLVDYLVREKGFNEERVRNGASKLSKNFAAKQQGRLDGFFKVLPPKEGASASKRKADDKKEGGKGKKAKPGPKKK